MLNTNIFIINHILLTISLRLIQNHTIIAVSRQTMIFSILEFEYSLSMKIEGNSLLQM